MANEHWVAHRFLKGFGKYFLFGLLFRVEAEGLENLPKEGSAILAPNHSSYLDSMAVYHLCPRLIYPLTAKWLFDFWWLGWILRLCNCVPTNGSSQGAVALLKKNGIVLIFPEGRCRNPVDIIKNPEPHRGVAVLALKTGAPVIPIGIQGTYEAWPTKNILPHLFRKFKVRIGLPLKFEKCEKSIIPEDLLKETLRVIMSSIGNLLK